jgi:hypothetical protein
VVKRTLSKTGCLKLNRIMIRHRKLIVVLWIFI